MFYNLLQGEEKKAWHAFRLASTNLELVQEILSLYHKLDSNMSFMVHFFPSHFDFFQLTTVWLVMNTVNVLTKTLQRWRNNVRETGPLPCLLTTVQDHIWPEMILGGTRGCLRKEI